MLGFYGGKTTKKNQKMYKNKFDGIENISDETRDAVLSEWYFMCKVRLKRAIDLENLLTNPYYVKMIEEQIEEGNKVTLKLTRKHSSILRSKNEILKYSFNLLFPE